VRQREPLDELQGSFVWRLTVKRHHRGWHAWHPAELGAPAIAHWRHFDRVRATSDGLLE
jgi:hypothetical protein